MVRCSSLKQLFSFGVLCFLLLTLNNLFIDYSDNRVSEQTVRESRQCPSASVDPRTKFQQSLKEIKCVADEGAVMRCIHDESEYYFPFSFLKKRFDVTGKLSKNSSLFLWSTSYSKLRSPDGEMYDPLGPFGHFATYNVENRERVRCINGKSGVPMSTQWDTVPYYYSIQIAQYGLQHYSRMKSANTSESTMVEVGKETKEWKGSPGDSDTSERVFFQDETMGSVVNVSSPVTLSSPGCYIFLNDVDSHLYVVSFKWRPVANASFTILVRLTDSNTLLLLNYVEGTDNRCVWKSGSATEASEQKTFSFAMGNFSDGWQSVTRDILVDAGRALSSLSTGKKKDGNVVLRHGDIKLVTIGFRGNATIVQRIEQRSEAHREFFRSAADWMVDNQNEQGGWSVPVERAIAERRLVLPAGWHSAMAQGHGLSLLTRAFTEFKDEKYLESAVKALELFSLSAEKGGVVNSFFGHTWYEEYPTTPGTFVLNGFMYSLIGLYDMSKLDISPKENSTLSDGPSSASRLFQTGIESLKALLPLFDTGSGSIYDLRHVGLKTAPNLARWDYHAVHVYLLKWLVQITADENLNETADRWIGYSYGKRAKHN